MGADRHSLAAELAALEELNGPALRARWAAVFGRPASVDLSPSLLRQALAHRLQEQALGGVPTGILRQLHRLAADARSGQPRAAPLTPGVRLVREWQGQHHVVDVATEGVIWQGRSYPSLSAVARAITGTRWSGPRFFGLSDAQTRPQPQPRDE